MRCEVDLREHGIKSVKGRYDLAILDDDKVIAIFEFKADTNPITDSVILQGVAYAKSLNCSYVFACNRHEMRAVLIGQDKQTELRCENVADVREIISGTCECIPPIEWVRRKFSEFSKKSYYSALFEDGIISESSAPNIIPILAEMDNVFLASSASKIQIAHADIKDIGVSFHSFGNAAGGKFPGWFRSFHIRKKGGEFLLRFALLAVGNMKNRNPQTNTGTHTWRDNRTNET